GTALPDWERFLNDALQGGSQDLYAQALALLERSLLTRVLRHTRGNQLQAAKILGITRGSLRTKMRALGITGERSVGADDDASNSRTPKWLLSPVPPRGMGNRSPPAGRAITEGDAEVVPAAAPRPARWGWTKGWDFCLTSAFSFLGGQAAYPPTGMTLAK